MKKNKIVICGGGSTYTPGIVKSLLLEKERVGINELWLYDIDKERQDNVAVIVKEVMKQFAPEIPLKLSVDPKEAFTGADFIMAQMRVGKLPMREVDEKISLKHGVIGQETCGAGGMAYGMRTIYPMVQLIDYCEEYASKTYWIVNYSNPAAIVAKATQRLRPNGRIINICDMPVEIEARMAEILGCKLEDIEVDYFGLNHFGWYTAVRENGVDVTEKLKEHVKKYGYLSEASYNDALVQEPSWKRTFETSKYIVQLYKDYLPNTYMQYYLFPDKVLEHEDINNTRARQVMNGREKKIFDAVAAFKKGEKVDLNQFFVGVHGKFIVEVVESLANDSRSRQLVMVPNHGAVPNLPDDAMVEIPAYITSRGPEPVRVGAIPKFYKGLIEQQDACESLLVDAAVEKSYDKALKAFAMNKTIPNTTTAKALLDEMIVANKDYWPELK